ncbi:66_t:CDS:2 [Acaulospora colombiana]|uniref:66_t:CDS:1 n=1 Tax=Acaulospora colombiana TaxID=27376 RepID=A0ACA9K7M8_9GLOM|nr:66_t:CDS:2 [Acaulospora colombiana]
MAAKRTTPKTEQEQMNEKLQRSENLLNKLDENDSKSRKNIAHGVDYFDSLVDVLGQMRIEYSGQACYIRTMEGGMLKDGPESFFTEPPLPYHCPVENLAPETISHLADFLSRLNDDKNNPISPLLLYSVFAIASRYSDDPSVRLDPAKPETAGIIFYNRARELLDDFLDAPRLSTVQSQILMLKFQERIRRSGFFFRSWIYFGLIVRMAQDLGLDKNYDKWNLRMSRGDLISRKRVWQVCFIYDQFMSSVQGRDVAISLQTTGIELPTKEDYEDEQELQIQTDFVHLVRLTKILSSVMSGILPAGSGTVAQAWSSNPKLQILDTALDAWLQALPPRLRLAANSISQISRAMLDQWGPLVFQYPIRGGNYGTYCLVAASMIHIVNMSSPDLRFSQPAHDYFLSALSVLKVCVEHSAAWELRDKIRGLEAAFQTHKACQSYGLLFHPGSHPESPGVNGHMNRRRSQMQGPRRHATMPNAQDSTVPSDVNNHLLSGNLPQSSSPPHFRERSLYMLADSSDHHTFAPDSKQFEFISPQDSMDENSLLATPISHIPMPELAGTIMPASNQFNPLISLDHAKRQVDMNGLGTNGTIWDANSLLLWTNPNGQHIWTNNGGISPLSTSTPLSATSPSGHQTPEHGSPYPLGSPVGSAIDPVVVASQNSEDIMLTPESVAWYSATA